jgi:hypothetical protein
VPLLLLVIAGLDPAIHSIALSRGSRNGMDARIKSGHDGLGWFRRRLASPPGSGLNPDRNESHPSAVREEQEKEDAMRLSGLAIAIALAAGTFITSSAEAVQPVRGAVKGTTTAAKGVASGAVQAGRGVARGAVTVGRGIGRGAVCVFTLGTRC